MVFWKKKKGDRPASEYEKRALKFDAVRAALRLVVPFWEQLYLVQLLELLAPLLLV